MTNNRYSLAALEISIRNPTKMTHLKYLPSKLEAHLFRHRTTQILHHHLNVAMFP